jgi:murein DD-endopeptidase MepM/ murein hydrolase activator NlpD
MARRLAIVLALALVLIGPAWGQGSDERQQAIQEKIARLRDKIAAANQREGVLTSEISAVTAKIRSLQGDVDDAALRLARLEHELARHKNRLAVLTQIFQFQTERLTLLRREHALAQRRLEQRLIAIYQSDALTPVEVVLSASSLSDVLSGLEYVNEIGQQDRRIAGQVARAKREVQTARARTERTRAGVARVTRVVEVRTAEQRAEHDRLVASQQALAGAREDKRDTLASLVESKREFLHEVAGLERTSAALAARIQAAQSSSSSAPTVASTGGVSASGFIWPVSGPVTSGFGWRWGRMHEGIDIAAPTGAPIYAAAGGSVIWAGWLGGYGNLVVVDHGGALSTAYAHMSSIGVGLGQAVGQGQVLGYVGCTGHCFGPHLHFEVRVNGAAVDPLGYL